MMDEQFMSKVAVFLLNSRIEYVRITSVFKKIISKVTLYKYPKILKALIKSWLFVY